MKSVTVRYERIQKKKNEQEGKKLLIRFVMLTNGLLISELMYIFVLAHRVFSEGVFDCVIKRSLLQSHRK